MIRRIKKSGVLYVVPAMLVIAGVMLYPLLYTIVMSFFNNTLFLKTPEFAGAGQYLSLFQDEIFLGSIVNTAVWTLGSVVFQFTIGFVVALLVNQIASRGKTTLRILLMIPWVLPSVIGSAVWKWMYNADYGIVNYILEAVGLIEKNQTWLSNPSTAMPAIIAVNVWKMFPFVLLMIEASLHSVSKELKEAALIDGANRMNIFKAVTWPTIAPSCYSVILLLTIWTLNAFTFVYTLTGGGPAHSTEVMAMYIYKEAFSNYDFGKASAASTVLFVLSMAVSFIYLRATNKNEEV